MWFCSALRIPGLKGHLRALFAFVGELGLAPSGAAAFNLLSIAKRLAFSAFCMRCAVHSTLEMPSSCHVSLAQPSSFKWPKAHHARVRERAKELLRLTMAAVLQVLRHSHLELHQRELATLVGVDRLESHR